MKINKEIRRLSREMVRASFTDGQLDSGKIASLVESLIAKRPRNYIGILQNLKKKYGSDLTTEFGVNRDLLGGMRIRVGSDVWDGSVRHRLESLQQQF